MARRMEIELTSKRDDGTWTWRAAGAREPKGTVDGAIVPPATQVGDVVKVEVEGFLDGLTVVSVVPPKAPRAEPERIDLLTPRSEGPLVTTRLARTPRRERGDRGERGDRDRDHRGRRRSDRSDRGERGPRSDRDRDRDRGRDRGERGERGERGDRDRGDRRERHPAPPPVEAKPKPKRLRPGKVHRSALLEALPAEQRPIAEQLLQGGIPAVRQAIEKQNEELKADGKPQVAADPLIEIAERLRNRAQAAAWRDRADAALAQVDDLDLRDLRSVVNAADDGGRDEEARNVAAQLREALTNRLEKEQVAWVDEVAENLRDGRVVRALRLSSRPPKAGSPLPPDLSGQLIAATGAALTSETGPQRWATILDALAFSPIRRRVVPESLPEKLNAELRGTIARLGSRLPEIAHIFDITPEEAPARPPRQGNQPRRGKGGGSGTGGAKADQPESKSKPRKRRGDKAPKPDQPNQPDAKSETPATPETPATGKAETPPPGASADEAIAAAATTVAESGTPTAVADATTPAEPTDASAPDAAGTEAATESGTPTAVADATTAAKPEVSEAPVAPEQFESPAADVSSDAEAPSADDAAAPEPPEAADASSDAEASSAEASTDDAGGEPTPTMVEEAVATDGAPPAADETPTAEADDEPEITDGHNGTAETNGESTADADDESVRIDS